MFNRGRKDGKRKGIVREYVDIIVMAVLLAFFVRTFFVQAFKIPSESMEDTLLVGDFLFANKFVYGAKIPFLDVRLPAVRSPRPGFAPPYEILDPWRIHENLQSCYALAV